MKRASAPSYDLFKLVVTIVLILILLLMLLRGCATISAAPAPTENPVVNAPAASDTAAPFPTETESARASNTPEPPAPSSTPTAELTFTPAAEDTISTPAEVGITAPVEPAATAATETATPGPVESTSCDTSVPSRLSVGDMAQVVQRLNMRSDASITAPILQTNATNTQVEIIGGPVCTPIGDSAYLWWQISLANGAEGWSAEMPLHEATYLLEPIQ
jgi:cytoskeletal protein RodZ